jgi:hypothetical protein
MTLQFLSGSDGGYWVFIDAMRRNGDNHFFAVDMATSHKALTFTPLIVSHTLSSRKITVPRDTAGVPLGPYYTDRGPKWHG